MTLHPQDVEATRFYIASVGPSFYNIRDKHPNKVIKKCNNPNFSQCAHVTLVNQFGGEGSVEQAEKEPIALAVQCIFDACQESKSNTEYRVLGGSVEVSGHENVVVHATEKYV